MIALFVGCQSSAPVKEVASNELQQVELQYAQLFKIFRDSSQTVVEVFDDLSEDRLPIATYRFALNGEDEAFAVPFENVATTSTTHLPFYAHLRSIDKVVACSYIEHVMDSAVQLRIQSKEILELNSGGGLDKEQLVLANPDVVLAFPFGNGTEAIIQAFQGPVLSVTEYLEPHPLGRLEWIKFFGILQGKEALADSIYSAIEQRYDAIRVQSALRSYKPNVFFGSYWNGEWHASGGESYMAQLIKDAGGRYLFENSKGSENISLTLEDLVLMAGEVQCFGKILHAQNELTLDDIIGQDSRVHELIETNAISLFYGNSAQSDLFGEGILEPDVMLASMVSVLHENADLQKSYFKQFP